MDSERDDVASRFARDLVQVRKMAGRPSLSKLSTLSGQALARATVSDILGAKRTGVPDWPFVRVFIAACRAAAKENGLDPEQLGTLEEWKKYWDAATDGRLTTFFPRHNASNLNSPLIGEEIDDSSLAMGSSAEFPNPNIIWGRVPRQLKYFAGRETILDHIHRSFEAQARKSALSIIGICGLGKTQLAVEYAHRYRAEYDLVWWVPCHNREIAEHSLADLQSRLDLTPTPALWDKWPFAELFDMLRVRRPYPRWLFIYDDAGKPDEIKDLLPPREGHVIITSRNNRWEASEDLVELEVFKRAESLEFLSNRIRGISEADADELASAVGDLPLALEHIAESGMPTGEYLTELGRSPVRLLSMNRPAEYPVPVADAWRVAIEDLRNEAPDAMDLLGFMAFWSNEEISIEALQRGGNLPGFTLNALLGDTIRRSHAIRALGQAGLLRVQTPTRRLQVHSLTQRIVRDMLSAPEVRQWQRDVQLLRDQPGND